MRRRIQLTTVLTALLITAGAAAPASADRVYPSQNDVRRAQQHAARVGSRVDRLQAQLKQASARADAADLAVSEAAEAYDSAQIELQNAATAAAAAAAAAKKATERLVQAQQQVGQLASQTYRSGGPVANLDVILSPQGPDDVLERAEMMQTIAGQRQRDVEKMDSARVVATTLDKQADEALTRQTAAAARLDAARRTASSQAKTAHAALMAETATRDSLLTQLAKARRTTVAVERAREAGLERAAQARKEAAARAAAERAASEQPHGRRSAGSSGSGTSRSGPVGGGSSAGSSSGGYRAAAWARGRLGLPYQWGGDGPGTYDCSGLTMKAWAQAGVYLPHSSRLQYAQAEKVSYSSLRAGDLIFYATDPSNANTIHHVTLYIGGGMMIEAPYTGANVRIVPVRRGESMPYAGRV